MALKSLDFYNSQRQTQNKFPFKTKYTLLQARKLCYYLNKLKSVIYTHSFYYMTICASVQSLSCVWLFVTHELEHPRSPCPSPTPGVHPNPRPLSRWYHPTISSSVVPFSSCPQSFPASGSFQMSQLFTIRWPKYWNFSFSISPSNEHPGLISFMMDWLDLLAVQGTLKSLFQHHRSKA